MAKIGIFYGSQAGATLVEAKKIQKEFGGDSVVQLINISNAGEHDFERFKYIIVGCPTWNGGELQGDWGAFYEKLNNINFTGKKVAYFGLGDQIGYPDNFEDAIGILEEKIAQQGGATVGYWSTEGYKFTGSRGVKNGKFVGLALDEDNQPELSDGRIEAWVAQLKQEFIL